MSDHDRERAPLGGNVGNGGTGNGDDRAGVEVLRGAVERVAAGLPERPDEAAPGRSLAGRTARTARRRALAAAAAVLVAAAGVAWMVSARGPAGGGARVAESELRIELFRVRGRAVPASVVAPQGAGSLLVIPQVEGGQAPQAPRGPNGVALPGEKS
jgi:hypothetical protein